MALTDHRPLQPPLDVSDLAGNRRRRRREGRIRRFFLAAALSSLVISALIVGSLAIEAGRFLLSVDPAALWTTGWFPREGFFDIKTLLVATLIVTSVAMVVAGPIGFAPPPPLSEYAGARTRRRVELLDGAGLATHVTRARRPHRHRVQVGAGLA